MHQDHRELPEYLQREVDQINAVTRRKQILAGFCASLIAGAILIAGIAIVGLFDELAARRAATETPVAP